MIASTAKTDFDVGIIGGGPAGSSVASYLARAGMRCVVFEGTLFPRPHVGESLVPAANRVLGDLGLLERMDAHKFPRKFGAVWTTTTSTNSHDVDWQGLDGTDNSSPIAFAEREQQGVYRSHTYHVDRGKFDNMLLQRANELGATVYEGIGVQGVDFSEADPRIKFRLGQRSLDVSVKLAIDASGRRTLLGNQLRLKVNDPVFDQYALHTWFDGYDRSVLSNGSEQLDYIYIHFLPISNTWVWQIPITDTVTSIGVVTQRKHFAKARSERDKFFWECLASYPRLYDALRAAQQVRPLTQEGDYSYAMKQICGDGFVMLGDAARFVDPIFSSGVSIAMNSARFASEDILQAAEHGDFTRGAFSRFETTMRHGTRNWYEFIAVYYRLNVLFTYFIRQPRYRLDILKLLQGEVYDEADPPVLQKMREMVYDVERRPEHPWHKLLNDLTSDAFRALHRDRPDVDEPVSNGTDR